MQLTGIISISGKPGLSKIVSQTRTGLIVESLQDGKRTAVHGAERVSSLEDISIYTYEEDVLLTEVFEKMFAKAKGEQVISHKSSTEELKSYMKEVMPTYDEDRVYVSDLKKLVQWYNILQEKNLLKVEEKKESDKVEKKGKKPAPKATKAASTSKAQPKKNSPKPSGKAAASKKTSPKGASKGK